MNNQSKFYIVFAVALLPLLATVPVVGYSLCPSEIIFLFGVYGLVVFISFFMIAKRVGLSVVRRLFLLAWTAVLIVVIMFIEALLIGFWIFRDQY